MGRTCSTNGGEKKENRVFGGKARIKGTTRKVKTWMGG
jgi:hypothetical protein